LLVLAKNCRNCATAMGRMMGVGRRQVASTAEAFVKLNQ
jgi:hypothetical protein